MSNMPDIIESRLSNETRDMLRSTFEDTRFTHPEIPKYIRKSTHHIKMSQASTTHPFVLHCVAPKATFNVSFRLYLTKLFVRAMKTIQMTQHSNHRVPMIEAWLIPLPALRRFPTRTETLAPSHINGGFTFVPVHPTHDTANAEPVRIFVFRREEMGKVLLHELLHHSPAHQTRDQDWEQHLKDLYTTLGIDKEGCVPSNFAQTCSTRLSPNEAIIETWANIFHCRYVSEELGIPVTQLIDAEVRHVLLQAHRLWQHIRSQSGSWSESTHAFSYIIIRAMFLTHLPMFLKWFTSSPPTSRRISDIAEWILQEWTTNFKPYLQSQEAEMDQQKRSKIKYSLRMTALGDL